MLGLLQAGLVAALIQAADAVCGLTSVAFVWAGLMSLGVTGFGANTLATRTALQRRGAAMTIGVTARAATSPRMRTPARVSGA